MVVAQDEQNRDARGCKTCNRRTGMKNGSPPLLQLCNGHVTPTRARPVDHVERLQCDPRARVAEK